MKIKDVKENTNQDKKTFRGNLRMSYTQKKFIVDNKLSIQKIFDIAIKELIEDKEQNR